MTVTFRSDGFDNGLPGFLAVWSATTEPPTYPTSFGCESCTFPFLFGSGTFDTCISVEDIDMQPWCSSDPLSPPTDEGTHIFMPPKILCFDSDSSCPSTSPQTVVTSPKYPLNYPNNADEVKLININYIFDINCLYLYRCGHLLLMRERGLK